MLMGYDEDEDFEEVLEAQERIQKMGGMPRDAQAIAARLAAAAQGRPGNNEELDAALTATMSEEEQFAISKKMFAQ